MQPSPFPFSVTAEPITNNRDERFLNEAPYIHQHVGERNKPNLKKVEHFFKKWTQYPEVWNWYHLALIKNNRKTEADKLLQKTIERFPDYIFARVNEAKMLIENNQVEKALEWAGQTPDLQRIFPDRTLFHIGEVANYISIYIELELQRYNIDKAEDYLYMLQDLEGTENFIEQYRRKIMAFRLDKLSERIIKYKYVRPEYIKPDPPAGYSRQAFVHKEIEILLEQANYLEPAQIDAILALPRETAVADLDQILYRTIFEYTDEDYHSGNYFSLPHAVWFLYAFRAVESIPLASYLLKWDNETLDYWYADSFTDNVWPLFFVFLEHDPSSLLQVLYQPNLEASAKVALIEAMEQFAHHYPERRDEVIDWFGNLLNFYIDNRENVDILDATMTSYIEYSALNLRAAELLPLLKTLHETESIDEMMNGNYEKVEAEMLSEYNRNDKHALPTIYDLAANEKRFIENINHSSIDDDISKETEAMFSPSFGQNTPTPKTGRNDPCPCGSGKKFKKCCGK